MEYNQVYAHVTVDNFEIAKSDLVKAIGSTEGLWEIRESLNSLHSELGKAGKKENANVVLFFADICGMMLQLDNYRDPFQPLWTLKNGAKSICPELIPAEHFRIIREAAALPIQSHEWASRLNDLVWTLEKDVVFANAAVNSYISLAQAKISSNSDSKLDPWEALERAVQLWIQVRGQEAIRLKISTIVQERLSFFKEEPTNFDKLFWSELVPKVCSDSELKSVMPDLEKGVSDSRHQNNWGKARRYNQVTKEVFQILRDDAKHEEMCQRETDLYIEEAEKMHEAKVDPRILQDLYTRAITACSQTRGRKKDRKRLLEDLQDIQLEIPHLFKKVEHSEDVAESIEKFKNDIKEKTFLEALDHLSKLAAAQSRDTIFESLRATVQAFPLTALIGKVMVDEKGKIIARLDGIDSDVRNQALLRDHAADHLKYSIHIRGGIAKHFVNIINQTYTFRRADLLPIAFPNPFVPHQRVEQFVEGVWSGLTGKWIQSLFILTPLLENSLRECLRATGYNTVKIDQDGIQMERSLTDFIYEPEFEQFFGKDITFQLQVLLTDVNGSNLRNIVAHGLVTDGMASSENAAFLWMQTVYLSFVVFRMYHRRLLEAEQESKN